MDRARLDWLHYKAEASLAARLSDEERVAQMRALFEACVAFQRTKSPGEIVRERQAQWRLDRGRMSPRYLALLAEANGSERGVDEDDR